MQAWMRHLRDFFGRILVGLTWTLVLIGTVTALITVRPAGFRVLLPVLLMMVLVWTFTSSIRFPGRRLKQWLDAQEFERAYRHALRTNSMPVVTAYLQEELPLPADHLRPRMVRAFEELRVLRDAVYDQENDYINEGLKVAMQQSADEARGAFWNICRNLTVVANQKVQFGPDHPKVQRLGSLIDQLGDSAGQARTKLAELTLGVTETELREARLAFDDVRRQSEALLELEGSMETTTGTG